MKPWLIVYTDYTPNGYALVRGTDGPAVIKRLGEVPIWSPVGAGWLAPGRLVNDIQALADLEHKFVTITARRPRWERAR